MRRLNSLMTVTGAMLISFGAHAGDIYEFASIHSVEQENQENLVTVTTSITGVLVGQTQVIWMAVPAWGSPFPGVSANCTTQLFKMLEQPGKFTLRVDIQWAYDSNGTPYTQYMRSCKLQRI
jgi:hypothetical protein